MLMSEDRNTVGRLESLKSRLELALSNSDDRPVWLHWTDVQAIVDAIEDINQKQKSLDIIGKVIGLRGRI